MTEKDRSILKKIEACLNMTVENGATQAEALSAMQKAAELMLRYNIDQNMLDSHSATRESVNETTFNAQGPNEGNWFSFVAAAAASLNSCDVVGETNNRNKYSFIGRPENREAAVLMFKYLQEQIVALWRRDRDEAKKLPLNRRGAYRKTYKVSAAYVVRARAQTILSQLRSNDEIALEKTGSTALVVVETIDRQLAEIQGWMDIHYPKIRASKIRGHVLAPKDIVDAGAFENGRRAGHEVRINENITQS